MCLPHVFFFSGANLLWSNICCAGLRKTQKNLIKPLLIPYYPITFLTVSQTLLVLVHQLQKICSTSVDYSKPICPLSSTNFTVGSGFVRASATCLPVGTYFNVIRPSAIRSLDK